MEGKRLVVQPDDPAQLKLAFLSESP
jgi:hypothetical protein